MQEMGMRYKTEYTVNNYHTKYKKNGKKKLNVVAFVFISNNNNLRCFG